MITLQGHLERIAYRHERSHYTIARLRVDASHNVVTVVGYMAGVHSGDTLRIRGTWETHEKYGQQFRCAVVEVLPEDPLDSIRKFLASGFVKGIGPKLAGKLLNHFDVELLNIIETDPDRLSEVSGISDAKAAAIAEAWLSHHGTRRAMMFLQAHGVKAYHATRILHALGADAVDVIKEDPYRLATEINEIDFFLADRLAREMGVEPDDLRRLKACLMYLMEQAVTRGDTCVYRKVVIARCVRLVSVDAKAIEAAIACLVAGGYLVAASLGDDTENRVLYLKPFYSAEIGIAQRMAALLTVPVSPTTMNAEEMVSEVFRKLAIKPSGAQLDVLMEISSHRAVIITGGPGTGKTTLIRAVCAVFGAAGKRVRLAAPTGRAARRLSEVTGRKAATIHKLLRCNLADGRFDKDENNPLEADVVIVDETSMVDTLLMDHLIRAVPMTAALVLVGDVFQLPSVGPGNVLSDMIQSGRIRTFELTEIFRQARQSPIIVNAHRVRAGLLPELPTTDPSQGQSEFYFIERNTPASVVAAIVGLCTDTLRTRFDLDPVRAVQVLTPMHKGEAGTLNLNQVLQEALNPQSVRTNKKGRCFRLGDKVMHLKNNYQKEVFNGDIGTVSDIDNAALQMLVDYDGREVVYAFDELDELTLAYAITVHKAQGAEYPAVIVPMITHHYVMLQRNLLYTALTRGQRLVFLIGSRRAIEIAVKNDKPQQRLSGLDCWLCNA